MFDAGTVQETKMAKYCSKCGKTLPDGVEICDSCHAKEDVRDDAALFTRMTAQTEIWKEPEQPGKRRKRKKRIKKIYSMKERLLLYFGAVVLVAVTAFIMIYTQPYSKVIRELKRDNYDTAVSVYAENYLEKGSSADGRIGKLLAEKAGEICDRYAAGTIDEEQAEIWFSGLYAFGLNTEEISGQYERFGELCGTQSMLQRAERLENNGSYMKAYEIYTGITEEDPSYSTAQERAAQCLAEYGKSVAAQAEECMKADDYAAAMQLLDEGGKKLLEYGTFSSDIDATLDACCEQYEAYALREAAALAGLEKYDDAAELIGQCMRSEVGATEALQQAYDEYLAYSEVKVSTDAIDKANEFYRAKEYAQAFKELETAAERVADAATVNAALQSLEELFTSDKKAEAEAAFAKERDKLPAALEVLSGALAIRELEGLQEYYEELERYLPLDLVSAAFSAREGEVYRNSGGFESLDGTTWSDGWLWGGNGASISYELDGKYDKFEGALAVRRDDGKAVSAYFEIWCDGELSATSETVRHDSGTQHFSFDISGCQELKIVFYCDYNTVTGEDGYCYHGICTPQVWKNMPA